MSYAYLDFKIYDLELAAYALAEHFTKQGLSCKVHRADEGFITQICKQRFFKKIIGTPTVIQARFFHENENSAIEVKIGKMYQENADIIRETLLVATILPGISKSIQLISLEKEVKKQAVRVAIRYQTKEKK